ncbi:MAG: DUF4836 family protein, partial [Lentimicrobiaceae bacterium]|nr:DUF4836 family protein [Lentimicrobiaceae bacterium]
MKKIIFLLLTSIIFCFSCTQSRKDTLLIPAKSPVIAAFNIASLIEKAQFDSISALHDEELLNTFPLLHALVKNATNTGIDYSGDLFVFFVLHNNVSYTCATIPLKDQAQTQKLIQNTLSN